MSRSPRAGEGVRRSDRCRVSWFSAVVLFMLLSASNESACSVAATAQDRVEWRSERHANEAAGALLGGPGTIRCSESVAPPRSPRVLPWSRSVGEHGLPLPRAPTA